MKRPVVLERMDQGSAGALEQNGRAPLAKDRMQRLAVFAQAVFGQFAKIRVPAGLCIIGRGKFRNLISCREPPMNTKTSSPTRKPTAYAYSRFSTKQQALGDSERRQQTNAEAWAKEKGYDLVVHQDAGISARHGANRTSGKLGDLLAHLQAGDFGSEPVLLIEAFDRMSREKVHIAQSVFNTILAAGATVITLHNRKVYKAPLSIEDLITSSLEMHGSNDYSEKLSLRVAASWESARQEAAKGVCIHRHTSPGWLRQGKKGWELIPERVQLLRELFRRYSEGEGTQTLAVSLNQDGVRPWTHKGQTSAGWHATSVKNVLRNRAVLGEWTPYRDLPDGKRVPAGEPILGYFPSVIEPQLFHTVQDLLLRVPKRGKPVRFHWNLTARLARSEIDGTAMWGQPASGDRKQVYIKSRGSVMGFTTPAHFLRYDIVEERLLALLRAIDEEAFQLPKADERDGVADAQERVRQASKQVEKYRRLVLHDDDPSPTLVADLKKAEREHDEAKRAERKAFDQREKAARGKFALDSLDFKNDAHRARLHATIAKTFESITFGRDHFHAWFDEKNRQGIEVPLSGELVFNVPLPVGVSDAGQVA